MSKFKIGDKVFPVSKSAGMRLEHSINWKQAKAKNQPYLFVIEANEIVDGRVVCSVESSEQNGDFFLESDLIPFEEFQVHIEPSEKPPVYYTLPAPVEEKIEPDYKGFYEFAMNNLDANRSCMGCVAATAFCTAYTCTKTQIIYAENKFIKKGG